MHFFQFEQHMADTAHKSVSKVGRITNIFFDILDLILQIASISSVRCFSRRNSSPKLMGTKITILRDPDAVSSVGRKGPRNESFPYILENLRHAFLSIFLFSLFLGLRRWKSPTKFVSVSLGKKSKTKQP